MSLDILIEQLQAVPDWRRGRKVQYPLWLMLLMTLLGVMSGCNSLRGLEDFMKRHQKEVAELFGLSKAKLPSYSTLRDMVAHVDALQVGEIYLKWAQQCLPVEPEAVVSVDGKALASTIVDSHGAHQNFVSVVSACVQNGSWVIGQLSFSNGQSSEITSVRQLLQQLNLKGVWVTLDALHTQKNSG